MIAVQLRVALPVDGGGDWRSPSAGCTSLCAARAANRHQDRASGCHGGEGNIFAPRADACVGVVVSALTLTRVTLPVVRMAIGDTACLMGLYQTRVTEVAVPGAGTDCNTSLGDDCG
jgi:hypothetical protein